MIARAVVAARRASLEPLLLRAGVAATAVAALLVAAPAGLPPALRGAVLALAVLPAVRPGGRWVTVVVLAAVVGWLADTGLTGVAGTRPVPAGVPTGVAAGAAELVPEPGRLLVLAGLLYLLHALAALVATLPYDAVVTADVVTRWLLRALGVVVASTVLSVAVLAGLARVADGRASLAATLAGLALAVGVVGLLRSRYRAAG